MFKQSPDWPQDQPSLCLSKVGYYWRSVRGGGCHLVSQTVHFDIGHEIICILLYSLLLAQNRALGAAAPLALVKMQT